MKAIALGFAIAAFTFNAQAQNTNVTDVSKTTVTTVKDSKGEKKLVKKENVKEVQNIEVDDSNAKQLNKDLKASPVQVTQTTQVTAPDGTTHTVDVDHSAYYSVGGAGGKYRVLLDTEGYTVSDATGNRFALMRRTSNNNYFFRTKDKTSFGYFDANGNLVVETYDEKTDKVTVETFTRNP